MLQRFERFLLGPSERARVLLEGLSGKGRSLNEAGFVLVLVFVVPFFELVFRDALALGVGVGSFLFVGWGFVVLRPDRHLRRGHRKLASASLAALLLLVPLVVAIQLLPEGDAPPRLGLQLEDAPALDRRAAEVIGIAHGSPSDGVLREGDRIVSLNDEPLSLSEPSLDLAARSRDPASMAGPKAKLGVFREGRRLTLSIDVGVPQDAPPFALSGQSFFYWLSARNLALLLLVVVIVYSGGQSLRQLGLGAFGLGRELAQSLKVLAGAYGVHLAVAVPLGLLSFATGFGREDAVQRSGFLAQLGEGVGFVDLALFLALAAGFEEVVFRGFLLTRIRNLVNRWTLAVLMGAFIFGVAHSDQGILAMFQTGALGVYFAAVFVRRSRAEAVIVAHATFNLMMFGALYWLIESGWLERARQLLPQ